MSADTDAALSYLREQFGEGWSIGVREARHMLPPYWSWSAVARHRGVTVEVIKHSDPMRAARACVKAWEAASGRSNLIKAFEDQNEEFAAACEARDAERAHADRLAEALRTMMNGWQWIGRHPAGIESLAALAAHDARRKP